MRVSALAAVLVLGLLEAGSAAGSVSRHRPLEPNGAVRPLSALEAAFDFYLGQSGRPNRRLALKMFQALAAEGQAPAQWALGLIYEEGLKSFASSVIFFIRVTKTE